MIRGLHGLFYSSDPEATRAFFRDVVRLPGCDVGEGWWIFDLPEGDFGVHPVENGSPAGTHDVSFYCDDIHGTVAELAARGARFVQDIEDHGYGLVTFFEAPGGVRVQLYEPRYVKTAPHADGKTERGKDKKSKGKLRGKDKAGAKDEKAKKGTKTRKREGARSQRRAELEPAKAQKAPKAAKQKDARKKMQKGGAKAKAR